MDDYDIPNGDEAPPAPRADVPEAFSDGLFTVKVSQDMALRNMLRSGLVEAVGRNQSQIPLFVSWPSWLDDGIVCLYARDLHRIIHDTVRKTVNELGETFGVDALTGGAAFEDVILPAQPEQPPADAPAGPVKNTSKEAAGAPANIQTPPPRPDAEKPPAQPSPPSGRKKPVTDQDIADQLFTELRKGKKKS